MQCPVCENITLMMSERNGVEIDYCPKCRGVWLDRGELDKIIQRSSALQSRTGEQNYQNHYEKREKESYKNNYYKERKPYKKKESFLSELFDF